MRYREGDNGGLEGSSKSQRLREIHHLGVRTSYPIKVFRGAFFVIQPHDNVSINAPPDASCLLGSRQHHIRHPPAFELPTSLTPSLNFFFSPPPPRPLPIRYDQDSTIHSYQTFLLSVARKMETVSVEESGV